MITGSQKRQKTMSRWLFLLLFLLLFTLFFFIFLYYHNHEFYLKKVSSDCEDFKVTGSIAYNQEKSSIYISNIDYCGEENATIYEEISCNLYEEYKEEKKKISTCPVKRDISLDDYLKEVEIHVDDYSRSCKTLTSSKVYLEIKGKNKNGKIEFYQVPIKLDNDCK